MLIKSYIINRLSHIGKYVQIVAFTVCCMAFSSCDVQLVETTETTTTVNEFEAEHFTEESASKADDSWKTATQSGGTTPPVQTETTVSETEAATTTVVTTVPTESETDTGIELMTEETTETENQIELDYEFGATILTAERKYIIVKPDVGTDEFEISRKIVVYCNNAVDLMVGDTVNVKYSGDFAPKEKDGMPVIDVSECVKTKDGEPLPDFMVNTRVIEAEVVRIYTDGFLGKIVQGSADFSEGDRVNINMTDVSEIEKSQIIEIQYKEKPVFPADDYPSVNCGEYEIVFSPSFVEGEVVSINDKGVILSYETGTFSADEGADIIIISDNISKVDVGDVIHVVFEDDISEEPYIIYTVNSFFKVME